MGTLTLYQLRKKMCDSPDFPTLGLPKTTTLILLTFVMSCPTIKNMSHNNNKKKSFAHNRTMGVNGKVGEPFN
jgi:hypothetical protein